MWSWTQIDWLATIEGGAIELALVTCISTALTFARATGKERAMLEGERREFALRRLRYRFAVVFVCGLTLVWGGSFLCVVAEHDDEGIYGSNVAAWVQAIGSIAALMGAAAIAGWQVRHQRAALQRAESEDRVARLISMSSVATLLSKRLATVTEAVSQPTPNCATLLKATSHELDIAANRMSSLFDMSLGGDVVREWIEAEARLAALQVTLELAADSLLRHATAPELIQELLADLREARGAIIRVGGKCLGPALMAAMAARDL